MPAYLIVSSPRHKGDGAVDALLCDVSSISGQPDRATDMPVKAVIADRTITIDDEPRPREIVSSIGKNGRVVYLLNGTTPRSRNRERRATLAKAAALLHQLAANLRPLTATSEQPEPIAESLQAIFDWLADEREEATNEQH